VNFTTFKTNLETLQKTIAITTPATAKIQRVYWGAPGGSVTELPCIFNALVEPDRTLGFGSREQGLRVSVQCLVQKATVEDEAAGLRATALWFAAKDAFDADYNLSGAVSFCTLKGGNPTVPVILQHAGEAYIGFDAVLEITDAEAFTF
jgi:hypothetical protein